MCKNNGKKRLRIRYSLVVEDAGDSGWGVFCPALSEFGACTASGATIEEAIDNGRKAIEMMYEYLSGRGVRLPPDDAFAYVRVIESAGDPLSADIVSPSAIRSLRKRLDLTQVGFANLVHVDAQTVSRWERGEVEPRETARQEIERLTGSTVCRTCGGSGRVQRHAEGRQEPVSPNGRRNRNGRNGSSAEKEHKRR